MTGRRRYSRSGLMLCIGAVVLLGGCAIHRSFTPEVHKVRRGDTLSAIAADYGLNWHDLARWNHINPPYTIYVGERLSLDPFPPLNYDQMRQQRRVAQKQRNPSPRSTVTGLDENRPFTVTTTVPRQQPVVAQQTTSTTSAKTRQQARSRQTSAPLVNDAGWRWPLADSVLSATKIESARHGINVYGVVGTPIYAARAGEVVYSGAGLQGIGQLVIIQHRNEYLSAYGYVRQLQVKEGERIAAGQHIADMGVGPGSRAELHFEIRHEGEPIKPQSVLPGL